MKKSCTVRKKLCRIGKGCGKIGMVMKMTLSFAPMEGVTGHVFRRVHHAFFPQADAYYAPFIAPDGKGEFKISRLRDILPENNETITLVPQVLANDAEAFLHVARQLADLGYEEVNLNIGCPSATVVSKHKGAAMLREPERLDAFLADVYARTPIAVSVKTRLGFSSTGEFETLMSVFERYPIYELIVHARNRAGMYRSEPDRDAFARALRQSRFPVVYNGNVFTLGDYHDVSGRFETLGGMMIGRGAAANPALFRTIRGGAELTLSELRDFHDTLIEAHLASGLSPAFTAGKMKELWFYMHTLFPDCAKPYKALTKARDLGQLRACASSLMSSCAFDPARGFQPPM